MRTHMPPIMRSQSSPRALAKLPAIKAGAPPSDRPRQERGSLHGFALPRSCDRWSVVSDVTPEGQGLVSPLVAARGGRQFPKRSSSRAVGSPVRTSLPVEYRCSSVASAATSSAAPSLLPRMSARRRQPGRTAGRRPGHAEHFDPRAIGASASPIASTSTCSAMPLSELPGCRMTSLRTRAEGPAGRGNGVGAVASGPSCARTR